MSENYKLDKSRSLGVFYHARKHLNCTTFELMYIQALDERERERESEQNFLLARHRYQYIILLYKIYTYICKTDYKTFSIVNY